jgi:organic hydroperoxide reductase OsmC/OhrA
MTNPPSAFATSTLSPHVAYVASEFALTVHHYRDYQQIVDFRLPGVAVLGLDESPPRGRSWGPSPAHLLGSAVGACLAGSLIRILHEAGATLIDLHTRVTGKIRNDTLGRPHVASLTVRLTPIVSSRADLGALPSPERLAQSSMVADALRTDLALWVAITPEVRGARDTAPALNSPSASRGLDVATPLPHFYEPTTP